MDIVEVYDRCNVGSVGRQRILKKIPRKIHVKRGIMKNACNDLVLLLIQVDVANLCRGRVTPRIIAAYHREGDKRARESRSQTCHLHQTQQRVNV